jgi:hypothetical protein
LPIREKKKKRGSLNILPFTFTRKHR